MKSSYAYFEDDFDMLKATNEYISKTKWGKAHKPDLSQMDSLEDVIKLFEEFI